MHDQQDQASARRAVRLHVPMVVDNVSGSESEEEDWKNVEFRGSACYNLREDGDTSRGIEEGTARVNGQAGTGARDTLHVRARRRKAGKSEGQEGRPSGEQKGWPCQGQCWTCGRSQHKSAECR